MVTHFHTTYENGSEPAVEAIGEEMETPKNDLASEIEVAHLQDEINSIAAAAQRLENEIAHMLTDTGGAAANTSEYATAVQTARDMHGAADGAKAALTNAPTDPKTGKKLISSKQLASLSTGMHSYISSAEAEGAKIEKTTAETQTHEEAKHEEAKHVDAAAKTKDISPAAKCTRAAAVCVVTPQRPVTPLAWAHEKMAQASDVGSRIADGAARRWHGFTASVTTFVTQLDPIGSAKHLASEIEEVASDAYSSVKMRVTASVTVVSETYEHTITTVKAKLHASRVWVAEKVDRLNPFKDEDEAVAAKKEKHTPIEVQMSEMMDKALEQAKQAKAVLSNAMPHISMPHLSDLMPSSLPSLQGVMGDFTLFH